MAVHLLKNNWRNLHCTEPSKEDEEKIEHKSRPSAKPNMMDFKNFSHMNKMNKHMLLYITIN